MVENDNIVVRRLTAQDAAECSDGLADLLIDCVEGGASVSFMLPLSHERAVAFWRGVVESVARGERVLLVAEAAHGCIVGTVQLILNLPENQPHRADVAKMLVHRCARRRGIAERLLQAVEVQARHERRTVLVLDTVTGGDAERLYVRSGWQRVGVVPNYALWPGGGACNTTFFHKPLEAAAL
ncbi:MAG: GNAT family N-acetyltransferase [Pseudomonadota bacterium]|nr:GNAT family N-acetyltransferase [Pseudomonadota bacterium]